MKLSAGHLLGILSVFFALACHAAEPAEIRRWIDAKTLEIEGKGWSDTKSFYDRFPAKAEKIVRPPIWALSENSAGMAVHFQSDATSIAVRWELRKAQLAMPHMSACGVSGVDLYVKEKGKWFWLGSGRPTEFPKAEKILVQNLESKAREFLIYFPLYNGLNSLEIGVPTKANFSQDVRRKNSRPIVFYGTSILQGACASRPGMAYPSILGRHFDRPTINLGFSGNGKAEPEVAQLLAELNPAVYVIDCLPNLQPEEAAERIEPFVKILRAAHPKTPIILVENIEYPDGKFVKTRRIPASKKNLNLAALYKQLRKSGDKKIYYVSAKSLLGNDGEATVDGTHPNDLGFMRMAEAVKPVLAKAVRANP